MASFDINNPDTYSASSLMKSVLESWGIGSLYKDAMDLMKSGLDSAAIIIELERTPTYEKRFAANKQRIKNGLPALSPAEYVAVEQSYRSIAQSYGLPKGFYDNHDDFKRLIEENVSPEQWNARAQAGQQVMLAHDPLVLSEYERLWGLSGDHILASILDPDKALPIIQRQVQSALLGARAARNGLEVAKGQLQGLADLGVNEQQAASGFAEVARTLPVDQALVDRYGEAALSQAEAVSAQFTGLASARRKIGEARQHEVDTFSARGAGSNAALSQSTAGRY